MIKESCCANKSPGDIEATFRCTNCGFFTCNRHGAIWTDGKIHCARCFSSLQSIPNLLTPFTLHLRAESPYRCLLVIDGLYIAGAQKSVLSLICALKELGIGTHLLSLYGGGQWFDSYLAVCEVITICYDGKFTWQELTSVHGFQQPHIISTHLCEPSAWAVEHVPPQIPLIAHLHSEYSEHENLKISQAGLLLNRARCIIVPSPATQRFYKNWFLVNFPHTRLEQNIIVIPNVLFELLSRNEIYRHVARCNKTVLLAPTRLDYDKLDIELLLGFLSRLKLSNAYHLVVAGDGEYKNRIENFVNHNEFSNHVSILGFKPDLAQFYQTCDAVLLFSKREAMPMVFLESIFYDRPLVSPRIGIFEEVSSGSGLFLYEPSDLDGLITATNNAIKFRKANSRIYSDELKQKFLDLNSYRSSIKSEYDLRWRMGCS